MDHTLYWIHLPEHSDPHTEGYVGITQRDPSERFYGHQRSDKPVGVGISQGAVQSILREGLTRSEALHLERSYRPETMIGWNIAKGGGSGMSRPGYKHTPEQVSKNSQMRKKEYAENPEMRQRLNENLSKGWNLPPSDSTKKKISQTLMGHEVTRETREKIKNKPKQKCPSCGKMFHPCGITKHRSACHEWKGK